MLYIYLTEDCLFHTSVSKCNKLGSMDLMISKICLFYIVFLHLYAVNSHCFVYPLGSPFLLSLCISSTRTSLFAASLGFKGSKIRSLDALTFLRLACFQWDRCSGTSTAETFVTWMWAGAYSCLWPPHWPLHSDWPLASEEQKEPGNSACKDCQEAALPCIFAENSFQESSMVCVYFQ